MVNRQQKKKKRIDLQKPMENVRGSRATFVGQIERNRSGARSGAGRVVVPGAVVVNARRNEKNRNGSGAGRVTNSANVNVQIKSRINEITNLLDKIKAHVDVDKGTLSTGNSKFKFKMLKEVQTSLLKNLKIQIPQLNDLLNTNLIYNLLKQQKQKVRKHKANIYVKSVVDPTKQVMKHPGPEWLKFGYEIANEGGNNQLPKVMTTNKTRWTIIKQTYDEKNPQKPRITQRPTKTLYYCSEAGEDGICRHGTRWFYPQHAADHVKEHIKSIHWPEGDVLRNYKGEKSMINSTNDSNNAWNKDSKNDSKND